MKTSFLSSLFWKGLPLLMLATSLIDYTYAKVTRPMDIQFNPALDGGFPTMTAYPSGREDDANKTIRFTCVAWDTAEHILCVHESKSSESVSFVLPTRGQEDYIGVRVEEVLDNQSTKNIGVWPALYRNGQSNMDYTGHPLTQRPKDFDKFWDQARKELNAIPLKPVITEEKTSSTTGRLYKVLLPSYGNITLVTWCMTPKEVDLLHPNKTTEKYPAIQVHPGAGANQKPYDRTAEGYITLSMNSRGHGPTNQYWKLTDGCMYESLDNPKNYYYFGIYMDSLRGLDFLFSRPEVDATRVGVEGSSQGGACTLAMCALDHRLRCGVAFVPGFSNLMASDRSLSRKLLSIVREAKDKDVIYKTLMYLDAMNMAQGVQCPIMITSGLQDQTCPAGNGVASYNRIPMGVPKSLVIDPNADHEISPLFIKEKKIWQDTWLKK